MAIVVAVCGWIMYSVEVCMRLVLCLIEISFVCESNLTSNRKILNFTEIIIFIQSCVINIVFHFCQKKMCRAKSVPIRFYNFHSLPNF